MLAVPGVHAVWYYSDSFPVVSPEEMESGISVFDYPPEEMLPDDDIVSSIGENHLLLVTEIIENSSYGLGNI